MLDFEDDLCVYIVYKIYNDSLFVEMVKRIGLSLCFAYMSIYKYIIQRPEEITNLKEKNKWFTDKASKHIIYIESKEHKLGIQSIVNTQILKLAMLDTDIWKPAFFGCDACKQ